MSRNLKNWWMYRVAKWHVAPTINCVGTYRQARAYAVSLRAQGIQAAATSADPWYGYGMAPQYRLGWV